jgi:hypothetical protein
MLHRVGTILGMIRTPAIASQFLAVRQIAVPGNDFPLDWYLLWATSVNRRQI